jgi:hemin uptake protein HemP
MSKADGSAPAKQVGRPGDSTAPAPVVVDSTALFGRGNEVRVRHNGQEYRLRITKAGKLILTK